MRVTALGVLVLAAAFAIAGCDGDDDTDTGATQSACDAAFEAAAAIGDMEDTVEDLDPAVKSCADLDEWTAASEAHPDALDGTDPETYLGNRCLYGESLANTDLCKSLE